MSAFRPIDAALDSRPKTHVSFRISLPSITYARSVEVVGSWDNYRTATSMEQDRRVGRDVWKGILTANGGLEMGSEHYYYFIVDRKHSIPDPQSPPGSLHVHSTTGKLLSVLYVPIELPPSPEPIIPSSPVSPRPASVAASSASVFADFDGGHRRQSEPQLWVPVAAAARKKSASFRDRLLLRRSIIGSPEVDGRKAKRRKSLGLQLSLSSPFLRRGYKAGEAEPALERDEDAIADIVGYIRSGNATPVAPAPAPVLYVPPATTAASSVYSMDTRETEPGMSSFYSSEDDENDEVATPTDVAPTPRSYPKYYNFDEIKPTETAKEVQKQQQQQEQVAVRPLDCLRDQVVGELQWRDEMVGELGYLRSVVV